MGELVLYHNDLSVCSAKVRMALAEKNVPWRGVHLDLRAGDTQTPEYTALNPNQLVPTLVHDGQVLMESNIIVAYVDEAWPDPPLQPVDAISRARMRLRMKLLDDWVHTACATVSLCIAFRQQFLRRGEAAIRDYASRLVDPFRRERLQQALTQGMEAPFFAPAARRLAALIADLDRTLARQLFLAGAHYSLADLAYAPYMTRLVSIGFGDIVNAHPHLAKWAGELLVRPAFKSGVEAWIKPEVQELFAAERGAAAARIARLLADGG